MNSARTHIRAAVVAGSFYEDDPKRCAAVARRLCEPFPDATLPPVLHGAMVPHAGWGYSGCIAGGTLAALAARTGARTFLMTGSVHTVRLSHPATDDYDAWMTPLGPVAVDLELRKAVNELDDVRPVEAAHRREHCLEVLLPLMRTVFGQSMKIVPCLIPPDDSAPRWGRAIGRLLRDWPAPAAIIVSADLTHYGLSYGFTPRGGGEAGRRWAHDTNDRELLNLVESLACADILAHAEAHHSTCGGGAVAATVAACAEMGAKRGMVLEQTDSGRGEERPGKRGCEASVGYAGAVFG